MLNLIEGIALLASVVVITASNPIIAVIALIAVFISVAVILVGYGLTFMAFTYLILYVGAVAILLVFVVMMMTIKEMEQQQDQGSGTAIALVMLCIPIMSYFAYGDSALILGIDHYLVEIASYYLSPNDQLASVGLVMFTEYQLYLIILSVILLLAILGPITLLFH